MGCSDSNSLQINQANLGGNSPLPYNANAVYNQNGQYNVNYVNNPNYQINNENNSNVYNTNYANHNKNVNNKKSSNVGSNQLKNQIENYTNNISLQRDVKSVKNNTNKNGENFLKMMKYLIVAISKKMILKIATIFLFSNLISMKNIFKILLKFFLIYKMKMVIKFIKFQLL